MFVRESPTPSWADWGAEIVVSGVDKRRSPRIRPYVTPCLLVCRAWRRSGYLTDLGPRGARVSLHGPPPAVGTAFWLELRLGRRLARSRVRALVRWVRAGDGGSHAFGLTFTGLKVAERRALQAIVDEFQRRAAQIA